MRNGSDKLGVSRAQISVVMISAMVGKMIFRTKSVLDILILYSSILVSFSALDLASDTLETTVLSRSKASVTI